MSVYVSASSRLHALLTVLMEVQNTQPLRYGWSEVLGIPQAEVQFGQFGAPLVARLVAEAADDASRAEAQVGLPLRQDLVEEWSKPLYAPGTNLDGPIHQQQVSPESLAYLHAVASVLRTSQKHEALPGGDELTELLAQVDDLAESVGASAELTDEVRQALLRRIAQLRFAIEYARVGGSEGVQEAVELLLGAAVVRGRVIPKQTASKLFAVVAAAFALFSAGPAVQASLEAWPQVIETLKPGPEETRGTGDAEKPQGRKEPSVDEAEQ